MPAAEPPKDPSRRTRVLVFPCGAETATEIHQALRYSLHVELFGASSVDDHGRFRFKFMTSRSSALMTIDACAVGAAY
jgi:hypothetical protein